MTSARPFPKRIASLALAIGMAFAAPTGVAAQDAADPLRNCPPMLAGLGSLIHRAALAEDEAALTFVGHATFLVESAGGVSVATDYNDYVRPDRVPTIATMNRAHRTHFSVAPDPAIAHVLRGWNPEGGPAEHDVEVGDVRVRNVTTNTRSGMGTEYDENSIFVVETAGLCIAHLGHLHHVLEPEHLVALGRVDVALAPVDGSYTLDTQGMIETLRRMGPRLVVPMHFFSQGRLEQFLEAASPHFEIARAGAASVILSRDRLPDRPTILVLDGPGR
ncbi:MBL fold metallo-hydrolase [Salinarimonas ramus]|uniref:Zn-dependent hydrolase n=1 Tax=Salinarimonas ramus TaxID=690164 RepID=A0A917V7Q7_9HYPH|nr:MBL fold metallo-hydrolase [Salinarimonas ramus]GGK48239.1 Zn-dependent hydrolase [Salinarimonas ramus]